MLVEVEVAGAELVEDVVGSELVVVGRILVVDEVVGTELVDEVVGRVVVVVGRMLVVVDVVWTELVDEVAGSVLLVVELVETTLVGPPAGTVYISSLEKPLSLL